MRKKIILFMSFILICTFFLSFGQVKAESEQTIRIWVGAIPEEKQVMEEIADDFTQETGIKVEIYQKLEIFTVPSALVNNAELDERPDIVYMQAPDIGGLVESGYLQSLNLEAEFINRFTDVAFDAFTYNNKIYGIGYSNSTYGLIYNKDLISTNNLPKTWEQLFNLADELTLRSEEGNIIRRGIYINATDMWFNYPLIRKYGGYYYGKYPNGEYNSYDIGLDNEGMLEYVRKIKDLKSQGLVLNNPNKKDYSEIISDFCDEKVAMFFYGLWSAQAFNNANIDYGIAPLPENSKPLTTVEGFVINKYTKNLQESIDFMQYIFRDENQQKLIEAGNRYEEKTGERNPTNLAVINSDYIQSDEILKNISKIGQNVEPFPNIPEGPLWYNQDVTYSTFKTIFFGDRNGNAVDSEYKLHELANYIKKNVSFMNDPIEYIEIPSQLYIFGLLGITGLLGLFLFLKFKRKSKVIKKKYNKKEQFLAFILLLPIIILLGMFYIYPIIHNIYLSLTDYSGINLRDFGFIGLANYKQIFSEEVNGLLQMVLWTIIFAFSVIFLSFIFGTLLASILEKTNAKIAKIYRLIYILPWVIPTVITLLMWKGFLETEGGLINHLIGLIGIPNISWLTTPVMAKISTILVMVWFSFPYYMVVAFGFLKSIPKDYYEAARMDGASRMYMFIKITLPLIFQAILPMLIMGFVMQLNQFGVYMLTQGGPASDRLGNPGATDLLITYVFNTAFNTKRYALAASYSVIIFIFVAIFALTIMKINNKKVEG